MLSLRKTKIFTSSFVGSKSTESYKLLNDIKINVQSLKIPFHYLTRFPNISQWNHNQVNSVNLLKSKQIIITTLQHCLLTCIGEKHKNKTKNPCVRVLNITTVTILLPLYVTLEAFNYLTDKGKNSMKSTWESDWHDLVCVFSWRGLTH